MIVVRNISKKYKIGRQDFSLRTLREAVADTFVSRFQKSNFRKPTEFYSLKNISFKVGRGETVGIVGHNGAGKTTLLKILAQITFPTTGNADLYGRVGSLIEIGAGFHPELTGNENIFLNGSLLGMSHKEIRQKYDKIISFAEIEDFVTTPIKFYSSGMSVRLAFSIAAHFEPDILLLDEVLAVGDTNFQNKCVKKVDELAKKGHTILLVSHDTERILKHCRRTLWIEKGEIKMDAESSVVVKAFESSAH